MLTVSPNTMSIFDAEATERILAWHCDRLTARFPDLNGLSKPELIEFVAHNRQRALALEIDREVAIGTFLDCVVMYGEDFVVAPWASDIVNARHIHGPDRMALIRHRLSESGVQI